MKTTIYCKPTAQGIHSFYLLSKDGDFFLFNQKYRKGVQRFFAKGVQLEKARDFSKCNKDSAIIRTMNKFPMYIRYIEKEYGIVILEQTKKRSIPHYMKERYCAQE